MLIVSFAIQKLLRLSRSHLFVFAFGSFTTRPASWEICRQVKKQQLELEIEQQTGSKSGKEYVKDVYCHPAYLTYMQSTSWEMLGWMKHKLESRLLGEISVTSDMQIRDQIRSVTQSCLTLCDPMTRSTSGLPVHHQLLEFTKTHIHRVSDAIQPSHPLSSPSPLAPNPSQRSNCQHPLDHGKSKRVPEKHLFLLYWLCQSLWLCGSQ